MPQTMASLDPVLKEVYVGTLNDQLENETRAVNRVAKSGQGVGTYESGGKYVNFPIHTSRNSGIGARSEGEALPTAGFQGTKEATLGLKYQYGSIELNGQTFELATSKYQTFANAVDLEMEKVREDLSKDRSRQYFGSGLGTIGTVVSVSGQVITVDNAWHFQDEEIVDIMTGATSTIRQAAIKVTTADIDANTVTVVGTLTGVAAGDIIVRKGSYNREWTGLSAIIDNSSTLYGIAPSTTRVWKAEVNTQGGTDTALSEATFARMADRIYRNGGKVTAILTTLGVQRAYWLLLSQQRRVVNTKNFGGGWDTLAFTTGTGGDVPIIADVDAPKKTAYFVNEKQIQLYRPHGFKFMDRDGSMWKQKVDTNGVYDAYRASLYEYSELGTFRRNTHGKVTNIIEDIT